MVTASGVVVTTSLGPSPELEERARRVAAELSALYAPRRRESIAQLEARTAAGRLLVLKPDQVVLRDPAAGMEYLFHPNMIPVRGLNWMRGARDLFLEAAGLKPGDRVLDCTLGFGTEATLAALAVGESGSVVGLESVPELAAATREGLRHFPMDQPRLAAAMRRVQVVSADYRNYLPGCAAGDFDVIAFDPFFDERLPGAENSVSPIAFFGNPAPLHLPSVLDARRVATRRVVIKRPRFEPLPPELAPWVAHTVTARHSRLAYSILAAGKG